MRVGFVIPYFYPAMEYGGTPRVAYDLAKGLARRGHSLKVLTTDSGGSTRLAPNGTNGEDSQGIQVIRYANISNALAYQQRVFAPPGFFFRAAAELQNVDVIHIHEFRSLLSVGALRVARSLNIPFVLSPHGGLPHLGKASAKTLFDRWWGKNILREAAAICVVSPVEERDAIEFGVGIERIFRLPSAIDADAFRSLPTPRQTDRARTILFLGRLNWIKNIDGLVRAFKQIRQSMDARLIIAGPDDGAERTLRRLVSELNLDDAVAFAGFMNTEAKIRAMVDSDVLVMPSHREGFPVTVLEALACRVRVVASSACDIEPWIAAAGATNSLTIFQTGDMSDLAAKLKQVLTTPTSAANLDHNRSVVLDRFSADAIAARAEELYSSIVARRTDNEHSRRD